MGLFGGATPCDNEVERATDEKNVADDWALIMEICDKAGKADTAKDYMRAIVKRINHTDPHIAIQAVTLLDACIKNCGQAFHIEVASREFENEYMKLLKKSHPQIKKKLNESLKKWAENEFKSDPQLNLIPSLYSKLRNTGVDFQAEELPKRSVTLSKDPNVVQSQDEADQIAKAIELSLKDTTGASPRHATASSNITSGSNNASGGAAAASLYPSTNIGAMAAVKEQTKVRALYDFEAAEDNELTFSAGEIIFIIDDSDPNWWKGTNQRGEGLFPANFVTLDLSLDLEHLDEKKKKTEQLDDALDKRLDEIKEVTEIDETKIDRLLHLLHEADPTNAAHDNKEMLGLEQEVNSMGTLIDKELEKVDRKHAQLTQLSSDLVEALSLYHSLMREPQFPSMPAVPMKMHFPVVPAEPPASGPRRQIQPPAWMYMSGAPASQPQAPQTSMYSTLPHDRQFMPPPGQMAPNQFNTLPPPNMMHQRPPHPPPQSFAPAMHPSTIAHLPNGAHGMTTGQPLHIQQMQQHQQLPPMGQTGPRAFPPQIPFTGVFPGGPPPPPNQHPSMAQMPPPAPKTM